ncbi:hypothetical protein I862_01325 [endosymbiont of Acanthamoeba sp. UWC8]|uniref:hypothetical protein n=1 Tax=endosymbiont of Acanthamoeba sp. UWC8 TaxID=86106 RepID=UPI0004D15464|nr:hypothetical protein [endosymbiont of Acanthamoeba sp. UWC8]AIF80828.1 hypothetical protein I862_01325 [endosymbiont of Acanthamoeba sp. UWC8]
MLGCETKLKNWIKLADALKINTSINSLTINYPNIKERGLKILAEALKYNVSLKDLYLNRFTINDIVAKCLSEAFKCNISLERITLNKVSTDKGIKYIAEAIKTNLFTNELTINYKNPLSEESEFFLNKNDSKELIVDCIKAEKEGNLNNIPFPKIEFCFPFIRNMLDNLPSADKKATRYNSLKSIVNYRNTTLLARRGITKSCLLPGLPLELTAHINNYLTHEDFLSPISPFRKRDMEMDLLIRRVLELPPEDLSVSSEEHKQRQNNPILPSVNEYNGAFNMALSALLLSAASVSIVVVASISDICTTSTALIYGVVIPTGAIYLFKNINYALQRTSIFQDRLVHLTAEKDISRN